MSKHRKLLLVIADGEHVRFVRPAADATLHSNAVLDSVSAHKRSADLGSDHPGTSMHTGSSAHHALAPRHDLHALEKEKFAHTVAAQLNAESVGVFDDMVLVAPARTLAAIRQKLDAATDGKVVGTLAKDLVHTPDKDLWVHVQDWMRPVHRVSSPA